MSTLLRQIRLAAGDYFMHGQDRRMRREGRSGNVCHIAIRLGNGLDVNLLRQRIAASPVLDWRKRSVQWGQKLTVMLNVRPQWKYIRNYGKYMR